MRNLTAIHAKRKSFPMWDAMLEIQAMVPGGMFESPDKKYNIPATLHTNKKHSRRAPEHFLDFDDNDDENDDIRGRGKSASATKAGKGASGAPSHKSH